MASESSAAQTSESAQQPIAMPDIPSSASNFAVAAPLNLVLASGEPLDINLSEVHSVSQMRAVAAVVLGQSPDDIRMLLGSADIDDNFKFAEIEHNAVITVLVTQGLGWVDSGGSLSVSDDRSTVTHRGRGGVGAAIGKPIIRSGDLSFAVTIVNGGPNNDGGGMFIGVTDADVQFDSGCSQGGQSLGIHPYHGKLVTSPDCIAHGPLGKQLSDHLRGKATGCVIRICVDMTHRQVSFAVNEGPTVLGAKLPDNVSAVAPWVALNTGGTSLRLSADG